MNKIRQISIKELANSSIYKLDQYFMFDVYNFTTYVVSDLKIGELLERIENENGSSIFFEIVEEEDQK